MSVIDTVLAFAGRHPHLLGGPLKELNRHLINHFATSIKPRPRAYSLWSPVPATIPSDPNVPNYITNYTSWPSLTNKEYSGRHLRPADDDYLARIPALGVDPNNRGNAPLDPVTALFARQGELIPSRSSLLFAFFAQWFTDSILRIDPLDRRKNTSNHDIDLCQIYGLAETTTQVLRSHEGGRLRSQRIVAGGVEEEFPEYLCKRDEAGHFVVSPDNTAMPPVNQAFTAILGPFANQDPPREAKLYLTGLERGNSTIGYAAISTIFLREHNRLAADLAKENPAWDDERLFQTARVINIVILMKLVVEDYINHILGHHVFELDHEFAEEQHWYRANWIALEFDLLYRWHGLVPEKIAMPGGDIGAPEFRNNNALLEKIGVGPLIEIASRRAAGKVGLHNTPPFLLGAEYQSLKMARDFRLRPYNEYRELFGMKRLEGFEDLAPSTPALATQLAKLYDSIDDVEFLVGLFGEEADDGLLFGELLNRMVAYDAFTQIFSNPLLSKNVYGPQTFTDYGLEQIKKTRSIEILVNRNVAEPVRASLGVL